MKSILPIILLAVSVGLFYFYMRPQYANLAELRLERGRYEEVLSKSAELRVIREELRNKLESFSGTDLEKLEKTLPEGSDIVQLVLDLDSLAVKRGIVMRNIKTSDVSEKVGRRGIEVESNEPYKVIAITFSFQSLYSNFVSFLRDLETSLRIMDVVSINIDPNTEQPLLQDYDVTINTYWLRD
jgi:Tfp pilus assembly protein PilO